MTSEVIDTVRPAGFGGRMTNIRRFDRLLRTVMWLDAFLSVAMVLGCVVAVPVVIAVGVPPAVRWSLGIAAVVCSVLLAAFGAVTAVALMMRMRAGQFALPDRLRLPLPPPMRPAPLLGVRQSSRDMHTDVSLAR